MKQQMRTLCASRKIVQYVHIERAEKAVCRRGRRYLIGVEGGSHEAQHVASGYLLTPSVGQQLEISRDILSIGRL